MKVSLGSLCSTIALGTRVGSLRLCSTAAEASWPLLTSSTNPKLKLARKLSSRGGREKTGLALLEGHRLVIDALDAGLLPDFVVLHDAALMQGEGPRLRAALLKSGVAVLRAPRDLVAEASGTQTPQGVLAVLPQPSLPLPSQPSLVLVCDGVSDPGNLGTLLRSAAGCGVGAALLTTGCSDAWGGKALRAGMGAQFRLPLLSGLTWASASAQLAGWGCAAHAADAAGAVAHHEVDWAPPSALVVGSEAHGLSAAVRADPGVQLVRIPLSAPSARAEAAASLESLNAAVAGSVILFEAQRQRLAVD